MPTGCLHRPPARPAAPAAIRAISPYAIASPATQQLAPAIAVGQSPIGRQRLFYRGRVKRYCERDRTPRMPEGPRHDRSVRAPPDDRRDPPRDRRRPLPRRDRRVRRFCEAGGNAIDAGCAAGLALGVLQSDLVDVAGVAPIMIYLAEQREVVTIAGLGTWPKALDPEFFMREHGGKIPKGVLRTVVPAAPDAWITALRRYGTMSFGEVAAAAIRLAREGFPMYPLMAASLQRHEPDHRAWPSSAEIFLPNGRVPEAGDIFRQTDLAASLQYMADEEQAASPSMAGAARPACRRRTTRSTAATSPKRSSPL